MDDGFAKISYAVFEKFEGNVRNKKNKINKLFFIYLF